LSDSPVILQFSSDGKEVLAAIDKNKAGGIPVVAEHFLMALEEIGAADFEIDYASIDRLIQAQGAGGKSFPVARKLDGRVDVAVSPDKMSATIMVVAGKGGKSPDVDDIRAALAKSNVRFGIKDDLVQNVAGQGWYNEKVIVAEGKPPEDGMDGKIEFLFDASASKPKPTIAEDGTVDFLRTERGAEHPRRRAARGKNAAQSRIAGNERHRRGNFRENRKRHPVPDRQKT